MLHELGGRRGFVVVSNREPYIHKRAGTQLTVERPAGGLTSALDDVLRETGGTWVAWGSGNGDRETVDRHDRVAVPPGVGAYTLKRVWLGPAVADNYYHGYANQVLWPLCHITLDRVAYRKRFWEDYEKANAAFAAAVLEEAEENALVWFHDYHLCRAPSLVREKAPDAVLATFWHIPWPDWSVFRICPQAREIVEGLLANDLVGFQIPLFARNFLDCVRETLDADIDYRHQTVLYRGRTTRLKAFPISVDFSKFETMAAVPRTERLMKSLRERHRLAGIQVGVGVDRLEYTKALLKRLQAISLFFERYSRFRGRFTFIQIAVPTRMKEPYLSYRHAVEELIERINRRYALPSWRPVLYLDRKVEHEDLVAYYRMADLAVVSSVYDGMNLVAKEYVASQVDGRGALILSEFAGAAEELDGALMVNPYDIEEFSDRIREGLTLASEERTARMASLRQQVREHDILKWIGDVLSAALSIKALRASSCRSLLDCLPEVRERIGARRPFLFLDFDGTLSPIVETPERAVLPDGMRSSLEHLSGVFPLAVVSGRTLQDLRARIGIEGLIYAGNHGAEIWNGTDMIRYPPMRGADKNLSELLGELQRELSPIQGILIEDKGITASIHFRKIDPAQEGEFLRIFWKIVREYEQFFRVTTGKKVLEIRPLAAWNKGDAVLWILEKRGEGACPVYIGDDTTDEDAYRAIKGAGISISIGANAESDYYLRDQEEVGAFLRWIADALPAGMRAP